MNVIVIFRSISSYKSRNIPTFCFKNIPFSCLDNVAILSKKIHLIIINLTCTKTADSPGKGVVVSPTEVGAVVGPNEVEGAAVGPTEVEGAADVDAISSSSLLHIISHSSAT